MATAFREFEDRRMGEVKGTRLHLALPPLTTTERIALEALKQIAAEGRRATKAEICAAIGSNNYEGGTAPGVINRLESKGYVEIKRFQRGFQVCIPTLGICTIPPPCQVPHWSTIKDRVPSITIQTLRTFNEDAARWIDETARRLRRDARDLIAECIARGIREIQAEESEA